MTKTVGRKCKYDESFDTLSEELASEGIMDSAIAKALGISERVFYEYQKRFPQFRQPHRAWNYDSRKEGKAMSSECAGKLFVSYQFLIAEIWIHR